MAHLNFDERDFRMLVDACVQAAKVPALEREIFDLKHEIVCLKAEADERKCGFGEIIDNGECHD